MGNCWTQCCALFKKESNRLKRGDGSKYFRSLGDHFTIEFENLVESDEEESSQSCPRAISEEEMGHLREQCYAALSNKQILIDERLQAELEAQEEKLRLEEEARCSAQRQAARLARERRQQREMQMTGDPVDPENPRDKNMSVTEGLSRDLPRRASLAQQEAHVSSSSVDEVYTKPVQESYGKEEHVPAVDWEDEFVSAHTDDSGDSEFDGFVNPVLDTPSWDGKQQDR